MVNYQKPFAFHQVIVPWIFQCHLGKFSTSTEEIYRQNQRFFLEKNPFFLQDILFCRFFQRSAAGCVNIHLEIRTIALQDGASNTEYFCGWYLNDFVGHVVNGVVRGEKR